MPKESAKQYHFVVRYDTETKDWSVEPDVSVNNGFGDVWIEDENRWDFNILDSDEAHAVTKAISKIMREAPPVE